MKRWMKYVKPYWVYFVVGPLLMIIEVVGEVFMPKFMAQIINNGVQHQNVGYIITMGLVMLVTAVLMMLGGIGGSYFGAKASINFGADVRHDVFSKVQKFSFSNIDKFSTASLVTRLTNDVTQMQNFINMLLRMCLRSPGMLIGALIMAININARLALILAVIMPVMAITMIFVLKKGFPRFGIMQTKIDGLNTSIQENLTNVRVVKSFVREEQQNQKFQEANRDLKKAGLSAMNVVILTMPLMNFFMNFTSLAVVWFGGRQVMVGGMQIGDLTAFVTYITQILSSLMMLSMIFMNASRAMASSKRLKEVLDERIDLNDENARYPERKVTEGRIEFKNVNFRYYKNSQEKVLDEVNLTIEPGQTVGIIGSTGCGKTTLVSMIPRLYDADEGQILVDGIDVRDYKLENLRDGVGMVLQKNVLFSGSIKENLLWGDENATDEEIYAAAESAQAHSFVQSFTDGYQMELGQGGVNVSGGQKQRLCIARALLKKPKILILDDSTSAVDTATEARIREAFNHELKDSTKIIIAQRITSVQDADEIIVVNEGKITGIGTHEQLLQHNEEYQEIYYSQMDKKEVTV
ncbi:MAG: ABC transporter ATP-binding protein [Lachnospiraceae bacterium]|jgi:ATP-binding cassette subfamily B multidrug efflux pump|nr:ABC transporter ATP-binding protein [Lachnospiraceae bacterium]